MDLNKMSPNERLKLCQRYFFLGFLALPFLWIVNTLWFGHFLFTYDMMKQRSMESRTRRSFQRRSNRNTDLKQRTSGNPEQETTRSQTATENNEQQTSDSSENFKHLSELRKYVIFSGIGSIVWIVVLLSWILVYQIKRADWGEFGDNISFNIPRGIP